MSSDRNCHIANYTLCDQGRMFPDALSGLVISEPQNAQSYFIVFEATTGDGASVASVVEVVPVFIEKVVFVSEVDGAWDILSVGIDGADLVNLTKTASHDRLPVVSPRRSLCPDPLFRSRGRTGRGRDPGPDTG